MNIHIVVQGDPEDPHATGAAIGSPMREVLSHPLSLPVRAGKHRTNGVVGNETVANAIFGT